MVSRTVTIHGLELGADRVVLTISAGSDPPRRFEFEVDHETGGLIEASGGFERFIWLGRWGDAMKQILTTIGIARRGGAVSLPLSIPCGEI